MLDASCPITTHIPLIWVYPHMCMYVCSDLLMYVYMYACNNTCARRALPHAFTNPPYLGVSTYMYTSPGYSCICICIRIHITIRVFDARCPITMQIPLLCVSTYVYTSPVLLIYLYMYPYPGNPPRLRRAAAAARRVRDNHIRLQSHRHFQGAAECADNASQR